MFSISLFMFAIILSMIFAAAILSYAATSLSKPRVTVTMQTKSSVKISWNKVSRAEKYTVYYSTTGKTYKKLKTTKYRYVKHSNLYSGKTYHYKVRAIKGSKKSSYSTVKKIKTLSKYSPGLKASASSNKVTLTWNSVKNATGYYVYRKGSNGYVRIATTSYRTYKDSSRELKTTYTYKVIPYIKNSGKIFTGTASVRSVTTGSSGYLLDLVKPYKVPYNYEDYSKTVFNMGGESYSHGFSCMGYDDEDIGNEVYFNLKGKYKQLKFVSGICDENDEFNDAEVYIYTDGDLALYYPIKYNQLQYASYLSVCYISGLY